MSLALTGLALSILLQPSQSNPVFHGCPPQGDARSTSVQTLNVLKNRTSIPSHIDPSVTLEAMLAPGDDRRRWTSSQAGTIIGYVLDVVPGGSETANCHQPTGFRDSHIVVGRTPDAPKNQTVVVEVTPRWRTLFPTKRLQALIGKRVALTGWLLFDVEHVSSAENTAPGDRHNWRGTAWEIHPLTSFSIVGGS
jgi:hypothetical protein